MKRSLLLLLTLALLLFAAPDVLAQEAEATPVVVINDAPVIAPDGAPNIDVDIVTPPDYGISNDTILTVGVLLVGIGSIVYLVLRGGNPDQIATNQLQVMQMNREAMAAQERAYQNATATQRQTIDALAGVLTAIAPLTPAQIDNALARYLRDVQAPGPEIPEPPAAP